MRTTNQSSPIMNNVLKTYIAVAATTLLLGSTGSQARSAYALANNGTTLITFDLATPGTTTAVGSFNGATTRLDGIDFRPANGLLYGYSAQDNAIVTIDLSTALTTFASTPTTASTTRTLGIDFNPVPDRMRIVNVDDQNLRINVTTGATTVDIGLAYAIGDANFGVNPGISEAAYTNSDNNPGTGTTLFYVDSALDILVSTTNPNAGSLNTIGALGFDTSNLTGFDILSDGLGNNSAYALLTAQSGTASLFTINLSTGAATLLGMISQTAGARPYSLAIVQSVPEPGALLLIGFALAGVSLARRARAGAAGA